MKKILSFLVVGVLGLLLYMPSVMAEQVKFNCEKDCKLTSDDTCITTCTFGITGNTATLTKWKATVSLSPADKVTMGEVKLNEGWSLIPNDDKTVIELLSSDPTGVSTPEIAFGSFTVTMPRDTVDCKITLKPEGLEVVEQNVTPEKQPSTGVTLPLIVLGCGLAVAIGAYYVTKKNTKMYKI